MHRRVVIHLRPIAQIYESISCPMSAVNAGGGDHLPIVLCVEKHSGSGPFTWLEGLPREGRRGNRQAQKPPVRLTSPVSQSPGGSIAIHFLDCRIVRTSVSDRPI